VAQPRVASSRALQKVCKASLTSRPSSLPLLAGHHLRGLEARPAISYISRKENRPAPAIVVADEGLSAL